MQAPGLLVTAHDTLKINIASELHANLDKVGVGWMMSREDGSVLFTHTEVHQNVGVSCLAELEAVKKALLMAATWKTPNVEVRLDVKTLVAWLQRKINPVAEATSIVTDILLLKTYFVHCYFVYILTYWNQESHHLATLALSSS